MINVHEKGNMDKITQDIRPILTSIIPIILTYHSGPSHSPTFSFHHSPSLPPTYLFHYSALSKLLIFQSTPSSPTYLACLNRCPGHGLLLPFELRHLPPSPYSQIQILSPSSRSTCCPVPSKGIKKNIDLQTTNPHIILHIRFTDLLSLQ